MSVLETIRPCIASKIINFAPCRTSAARCESSSSYQQQDRSIIFQAVTAARRGCAGYLSYADGGPL